MTDRDRFHRARSTLAYSLAAIALLGTSVARDALATTAPASGGVTLPPGVSAREFRVADFGAKGDGITNDRPSITALFLAARAYTDSPRHFAVITFPAGVFLLGEGPPVEIPSRSIVRGVGERTVLLRAPTNTALALITNAVYGIRGAEDIEIRDLTFDSDGAAQLPPYAEARHAIALIGASSAIVTRCRFRRLSGDGIYVGSTPDGIRHTTRPRLIRISNCTFDGRRHGRNGISLIDVADVIIADNDFVDVAAATMPGAVDLEPNSVTEAVTDVLISGNSFRGCRQGVQLYNNARATIARVTLRDNDIDGGRDRGHGIFTFNATALAIVHNSVRHVSDPGSGIQVEHCPGATISRNTIADVANAGISLVGSHDGDISNNVITDTGTDAIRLSGSERTRILSNEARGWGRRQPRSFSALRGLAGSSGAEVKDNTFTGDQSPGTIAVATDDGSTAWIIDHNSISGVEIPCRTASATFRAGPCAPPSIGATRHESSR